MHPKSIYCPEYDDYSKPLSAQNIAFIVAVLRSVKPMKFPEIRVFTDYEALKRYIESAIQHQNPNFEMFPILYADRFSSSHFSALSICIQDSKINFLYFDSVGMICNTKLFFNLWNEVIPNEKRGIFAGYCPVGIHSTIQRDLSSCSFFALLYLLKSSRCKNFRESLELLGYSELGINEDIDYSKVSKMFQDLSYLKNTPQTIRLFYDELSRLLGSISTPLCKLSPKILKYAQTNLHNLKGLVMEDKVKKFLNEQTYKVAYINDDGECEIKSHNRAIFTLKRKLLLQCAKFLTQNPMYEFEKNNPYLNNEVYIQQK